MASRDFDPLDFGDVAPDLSSLDTDISAYLPPERPARIRAPHGPVSSAVNKDLPPEARALLDVIASDEAPDYNTMYGGHKFSNLSQHPGIYTDIKSGPNAGKKSSAAGRYQFLKSTWDSQADKLGLKDFSPESQDIAAWDLASSAYERKTGRDLLGDLRSGDPRHTGRISSALSSIWTSLPGGIEQRSHASKFVNRYAESLARQGGEAPAAAPEPSTEGMYDIPLSNGQTFRVPNDVPREKAIADLRASGMDVEGLRTIPLTNKQSLHLPDSANVNEVLAHLQKQFPDQEWMTEEHAAKTGLAPAFGATIKGLIPTAQRGVGEIAQEFGLTKSLGDQWIKDAEARQAEINKGFEETLPTDPLSKRIAQGAGTVLGGAAGTLPLAGLAMTGGLGAGAAALMGIPMAAGSLGQRYAEQGKDMSLAEPGNLATVAAEAAGNVLPLAAGKAGASLLQNIGRGAAAAGAVDVPSVALERAAAGQPLADEKALEEYLLTGAGSVLGGGAAGALGGRRAPPELGVPPEAPRPEVVPEGPAPEIPPTPEALRPEGVAPETPIIPEEQAAFDVTGEAGITPEEAELVAAARARAEAAPEMAAPEFTVPDSEIPEPTIRGEEQAMPTVEEAVIPGAEGVTPEAEAVTPEAHFAESVLGLKPTKAKTSLYNKLQDLDIDNIEDHPKIEELVGKSRIIPGDKLDALSARMKEVEDAQQIPQAGAADGRGGAQPGFREEGRDQAVGGEGVEPSGQGVKAPEERKFAKEEVAPKSAAEMFEPKSIEEVRTPGFKSREKLIEMPIDHFLKLAERAEEADFKREDLAKSLDAGEKLRSIPQLWIASKEGQETVVGHEGRHRAMALKRLGYTSMPVRITHGSIRWSEQQDPRKFDYREEWPTTLKGQNGDIVEFPVKREEAEAPYTPATETAETRKYAKAEEPTHIDVDGIKRPVTDSTGQRIHTTDEGIKNFWKGFEGTKAVDEEGRPIVIYRGSSQGSEAALEGKAREGYASFGSNSPYVAASYAGPSRDEAPAQNVIAPYYINAKKLIEFPVKNYRFDKFEFDRRAKTLAPGEVLVARGGQDTGPRANMDIDPKRLYSYSSDIYAWGPGTEVKSAIGNKGAFDTTKADIREARGVAPEAAHTVETLDQQIKQTYGKEAPRVDVLTREQAGVEPNVKGFYDPSTKRVALIADNIGKGEDVHGLMRHEVAVHARRLGKSDPEFQAILDRLQTLKDSGDASIARAYDRVPKDTNPEHIHEEALAYLSQHAPNLPIVKSFTSWMRRMAHKLTGSANWLKADDFGPMADAILKRPEAAAPKAEGRMYAKGPDFLQRVTDYAKGTKYGAKGADTARPVKTIVKDSIRKNSSLYERMEEFYNTKIRQHVVAHDSLLDMLSKDDPTMSADGKVRAKLHRDQAKRWAQIVTNSLQRGYTAYDPKTGIASVVDDARLAPVNLIARMNKLSISPEAFSNAMIIMTKQGHRLRQQDRAKALADARTNLKYVNTQIDYLKKLAQAPNAKVTNADIESARKVANQIRARITNLSRRYQQLGGEAGPYATDITPELVADAKRVLNSYPDVSKLRDDILEYYRKNAKLHYDSGLVSKAAYENFIKDKYAYTPLYMSAEELEGDMPGFISTMGGQKTVKGPKALKGGEHAVNFAENLLTSAATSTHHALKNSAEVATLNSPGLQNLGIVRKISDPTFKPAEGAMVVAVKENGNTRYYKVDDPSVYDAFGAIHNMGLPKWLSEVTKFQSRMAIMTPTYWGDQMAREPFMATFTSNVGLISPVHMLGEFVGLMSPHFTGKETTASRIYKDLQAQGVTGSHEYIKNMQAQFAKGNLDKSVPKKMWDAWAGIHEYIDASAKVAVMRKAEKLAREGKLGPTGEKLSKEAAHLEAVSHVQDMFNLSNRGSHAALSYAMQTQPFINSWAQGLDALVRNATGFNMSEAQRKRAVKQFWTKALTLAALYAAFTQVRINNSEDYREASPDEWSNNTLVPGVDGMEKHRMFHAKQPFEVGAMFMFPVEAAVRYFNGLDRGKNYWKTSGDVMWKSFAPPGMERYMLPSPVTPLIELGMNQRLDIRDLFGKEAVPIKKEGIATEYQGIGKSELADGISKLTGGNIAPADVNFLGQKYFSGVYNAVGAMANGISSTFGTKNARADLRDITERVPFIRGFVTNPDMLDQATVYDILNGWKEPRETGLYATRRGLPGGEKYLEEAKMAKAAERFNDIISKTNIAIEQLKNDPAYAATEKARKQAEKEYKELIQTKRDIFKQIEELHAEEE